MDPQLNLQRSMLAPTSDLIPASQTQSHNPAQGEIHCGVTVHMRGFAFGHFYIEQREK